MAPVNVGEPDQSERMYALLVSANYFSALGLRPALGRFISPEEASHPGGDPVVVISHDLWQTRFGGGRARWAKPFVSTTACSQSSVSRRRDFKAP
jgi:hypothetical protein